MPRNVVLVSVAVLLVFVVAGAAVWAGGNSDDPGAPQSPQSTATIPIDEFGPAPTLGGWVLDVFPAHASAVPQELTRGDNSGARGVCFEASFHDLPENALWFRMAVDDKEVTTQGVWTVSSRDAPEGGRFCYDPPEGLSVGLHTAAVTVQNPNNPAEETRQAVGWAFEVIP